MGWEMLPLWMVWGGVLLSHLPSPAPRVPPSTCPVASHHSIWAVLFVGKGCGHGGAGEGAASVAKKLIDMKGRHRLSFEQCFIICLVFSIQKNPSLFLFYSDSKKKKKCYLSILAFFHLSCSQFISPYIKHFFFCSP